jgi:hypothetical protein
MSSTPDNTRRDAIRRFLNRASLRAAIPYVVVGLLLLAAVVVLGSEIERHIDAIEAWIANLGAWGMVAYVGLFVLATSCFVPDTAMCIVAGALFGMVRGACVVVVGMLISEVLQFAISRQLLRARIEQTLATRPSLAAIQRAVIRDEFRLQVLLRLAPLNPATINYLLRSRRQANRRIGRRERSGHTSAKLPAHSGDRRLPGRDHHDFEIGPQRVGGGTGREFGSRTSRPRGKVNARSAAIAH